jgi:hypothetical protein
LAQVEPQQKQPPGAPSGCLASIKRCICRVAEPDLDFREFCRRSKLPRSEHSWDLFAAERYRRGETDIPSYEAYNPFRHRQPGPYA